MSTNEKALWQGVNSKLQARAQLPYFYRLWLEGKGDEDYNTVADYLDKAQKEFLFPNYYFIAVEDVEEKQKTLNNAFDAWKNLDLTSVRDHLKEFWGL